jgi:hypothetical protein
MDTHVKVLAVLNIALSAFGLMAAVFLMLALGVAGTIVGANADPHDAAIALPIIGLTGTALVTFLLIVALPGIAAGIGLLKYKPWARILAIVLSVINLIHIPFGTVVGIYGLWVLFNKETEAMFSGGVRAA